jgi:hypothetical protein
MRVEEIISETVEKADINWQRWAVAMAASAVERNVPKGIDGIVYLGLIGDPKNVDVNVRLRRPVQIGLDMSPPGNGYLSSGVAAQFLYGDHSFGTTMNIAGANGAQVGRDFDILINWQGNTLSEWATIGKDGWNYTIAHELMHRGFAIIESIPEIMSKIPEPTKSYIVHRYSTTISGLIDLSKPGAFAPLSAPGQSGATLEHLMIYAMLENAPKVDSSNSAQRVAEVNKYRSMYLDIEAVARAYILSYPIPKGSLTALRSELDGKTPDNIDVKVAMLPDNTPTVTLIKSTDTAPVSTANSPAPVTTGSFSGDPVKKGVVKKTAPPIKLKGMTLSDD